MRPGGCATLEKDLPSHLRENTVLAIVIAMLVIVAIAAAVVAYVAFPHRGEDLPGATWLGDAMSRAVESLPTVDDEVVEEPQHRR